MKETTKLDNEAKSQTNRPYQYILKIQFRLASYLNNKTAGWSQARLKLLLVIFCLTLGNISLYIISQAISSHRKPLIQRTRSTIRSPVLNHSDSVEIKIHNPFNTNSNEQSNTK